MRDPSIHIKRSNLQLILSKYGITTQEVNDIMLAAKQYSIRNRVMVHAVGRAKKKVERLAATEINVADKFAAVYASVMVAHSIKTLAIKSSDPNYAVFKEVISQANDFCRLFDLDYMEGFKLYLEYGVTLLGNKYSLYRLKGYSNRIVEYHKDMLLISDDPAPEATNKMHQAWIKAVHKYFGTSIPPITNLSVYAHFIRARNDADSVQANYIDWVNAQFEKWHYLNSIPEFSQLYGDNAKLIYNIYMAKIKGRNSDKEDKFIERARDEKPIPLKSAQQEEITRKSRIRQGLPGAGPTDHGGEGTD